MKRRPFLIFRPLPAVVGIAAFSGCFAGVADGQTTVPAGQVTQGTVRALPDDTRRRAADLFGALVSADTLPMAREAIVLKLLGRRVPEVNARLAEILADASQPAVQLSIARGLSGTGTEDAACVVPLTALLRADRQLAEAAIEALVTAGPPGQVQILLRAASGDAGLAVGTRAAATRALGQFPEMALVPFLLACVQDVGEAPVVRRAAGEALRGLSGIDADPLFPGAWLEWWQASREMQPQEFKFAVLSRRDRDLRSLRYRFGELNVSLRRGIQDQLQRVPVAERPAWLLELMDSPQASIRAAAARLVRTEATEGRPPDTDIRSQLRAAVADADPGVRQEVAMTLALLNDKPALPSLLGQMSVEKNTEAKAAQAAALGSVGDVQAVGSLLQCLDDPSSTVILSAARSLAELSPAISAAGPELGARVNAAALKLLEAHRDDPLSGELRAGAIAAMVVRPGMSAATVMGCVSRAESPQVRLAAMVGLAEFRDAAAVPLCMEVAQDASEPTDLRCAAIKAVAAVPGGAQLQWLRGRLDADVERDPAVRLQAWESLRLLLPQAGRAELAWIAESLGPWPERRADALRCLATKLEAAGEVEALALVRQQIGESLNQSGQPSESLGYLRKAFDYWRETGRPATYASNLFRNTLDGLLKTQRFAEACTLFTNATQWDATLAGPMLVRIEAEARSLKNNGDDAGLDALITGFSRPGKSLSGEALAVLRQIRGGPQAGAATQASNVPPVPTTR